MNILYCHTFTVIVNAVAGFNVMEKLVLVITPLKSLKLIKTDYYWHPVKMFVCNEYMIGFNHSSIFLVQCNVSKPVFYIAERPRTVKIKAGYGKFKLNETRIIRSVL